MAASIARISSVRPINGHDRRTQMSLEQPTGTTCRPFLTFSTCLRRPSVADFEPALHRPLEHESRNRDRRVDGDVESHLRLVAVRGQRVTSRPAS